MTNEGGPGKSDKSINLGRLYARINREGRETFKTMEDFPFFEGFSEKLEPMVTTWLEFTKSSLDEVDARILKKLEAAERETGVSLYLAGRDFAVHTTLLQGKKGWAPETEVQEKFTDLTNDTRVHDAVTPIVGTHIPYKYLLMDKKGNVLLTSTEIPESIPHARTLLSERYTNEGFTPVSIPILHSSIARVKKFPEANSETALERFAETVKRLRHEISAVPLDMIIADVRMNHGYVSQDGPSKSLANENL